MRIPAVGVDVGIDVVVSGGGGYDDDDSVAVVVVVGRAAGGSLVHAGRVGSGCDVSYCCTW